MFNVQLRLTRIWISLVLSSLVLKWTSTILGWVCGIGVCWPGRSLEDPWKPFKHSITTHPSNLVPVYPVSSFRRPSSFGMFWVEAERPTYPAWTCLSRVRLRCRFSIWYGVRIYRIFSVSRLPQWPPSAWRDSHGFRRYLEISWDINETEVIDFSPDWKYGWMLLSQRPFLVCQKVYGEM